VTQDHQVQPQGFNECTFANARHTADAQPERFPGVGQQVSEQLVRLCTVIGPGGFKQRDGLGHAAALRTALAAGNVLKHDLQVRRHGRTGLKAKTCRHCVGGVNVRHQHWFNPAPS
jgi:hypothetical protein